ncbi:MAG: TRAP transporter substrate-binding protein DctP [Flavobacteriales bacterium]|nr:TRAP transporter substrate-binding protein DctP [Flavobacteriales bacterium]
MKKCFFSFKCIWFVHMDAQTAQKFRFGSVIPPDSPWEEGINEYAKKVETKSGGQITFKKYLGGQLGGEVEMIKSIAMGSLDGGAFSTAALAEALNIPELETLELPFLFESDKEADYVMDNLFDVIAKYFEEKGVILVMWGTNGWRSIGVRNKPINVPGDLKGLKMRSQESSVYINFYKTLGATAVPLATPDVLMSLKTGMVDGYDQTPIFSYSTGWINSVTYYSVTRHIYQPGAIVVSKKFYDKLSDNLKEALLVKSDRAALQAQSRALVRAEDDATLNGFHDLGVKVNVLTNAQRDEFKKACEPVYKQLEAKVGSHIIKLVRNKIKEFQYRK